MVKRKKKWAKRHTSSQQVELVTSAEASISQVAKKSVQMPKEWSKRSGQKEWSKGVVKGVVKRK